MLTFGEYGGFPQGRVFNIYQANDVISQTRGCLSVWAMARRDSLRGIDIGAL